jgi:hypothetical protein
MGNLFQLDHRHAHFTPPIKSYLKWIPSNIVQNMTSSGTYILRPIDGDLSITGCLRSDFEGNLSRIPSILQVTHPDTFFTYSFSFYSHPQNMYRNCLLVHSMAERLSNQATLLVAVLNFSNAYYLRPFPYRCVS